MLEQDVDMGRRQQWLKRSAVVLAVAVVLLVLPWVGLRALQLVVRPPYQVKVVNASPNVVENVILHASGLEPKPLGDYEPGAVRTFKDRLGDLSIYLTYDVGETQHKTREYYVAWEFIYEFKFTQTGQAEVTYYSHLFPASE